MRSVDHLLRPDERIRLVSREHGVVLVGAFIRATLTLAVVGGLAYELAGVRSMGVLPTAVAVLAGVIAVLALTRLCRRVGTLARSPAGGHRPQADPRLRRRSGAG